MSVARPKHKSKNSKSYKKAQKDYHKYRNEKNIEQSTQKIPDCADLHVHTRGSFDAIHKIEDLTHRAETFKVKYISFTDHNTFDENIRFFNKNQMNLKDAIHEMDRISIIPGAEITCRIDDVKNLKGNPLKIHMLVYSPILTPESFIVQLMKIKHGNDIAYDFGTLINMAKYKNIDLDPEKVKDFVIQKRLNETHSGFSTFSREDVWDFFKKNKINIAPSMAKFNRLYDEIERTSRLNLSAKDVIDLTHASGGMCVLAHPKVNLSRTNKEREAVNTLLEYGIDGFEMMGKSMDKETFELISKECSQFHSKNQILYTGGSDFHIYTPETKIGMSAGNYITLENQEPVIKAIKQIQKAREQKYLTSRYYNTLILDDLNGIINDYAQEAKNCGAIFTDKNHKYEEIYLPNQIDE